MKLGIYRGGAEAAGSGQLWKRYQKSPAQSNRDKTGCDKNVSLFSLWLYLVYRNSLVICYVVFVVIIILVLWIINDVEHRDFLFN